MEAGNNIFSFVSKITKYLADISFGIFFTYLNSLSVKREWQAVLCYVSSYMEVILVVFAGWFWKIVTKLYRSVQKKWISLSFLHEMAFLQKGV